MFAGYNVLAYLFLLYLRPRHVTVLRKIFVTLGCVVSVCGLTHGSRALGFFIDLPWGIAWINLVSALVIITMLVMIIPMIPTIMKFPSASSIARESTCLRQEVSDLLDRNAKLATVDNLRAVANIQCAIRAVQLLADDNITKREAS